MQIQIVPTAEQAPVAQVLVGLSPSPVITVARDKFSLRWPQQDPNKPLRESDRADVLRLTIAQALRDHSPFDSHFTAYAPPSCGYLLAKKGRWEAPEAAAGTLDPVRVLLLVVDVDDPERATDGHARADWRSSERDKCHRLWALRPGFARYDTKGGYRLVWALTMPFIIRTPDDDARWSSQYEAALDWLQSQLGIVADRSCKDWTRLYRLPFVTRDGVLQTNQVEGDMGAGAWTFDVASVPNALTVRETSPSLDLFSGARASDGTDPRYRCPDNVDPSDHLRAICGWHPPAVQGEGGHRTLLSLARHAVTGLDVDAGEAFAIAWEVYNPRCQPPWGDRERDDFERKFDQVSGDHEHTGYLLQGSGDDAGSEQGPQPKPGKGPTGLLGAFKAFDDSEWRQALAFDELQERTVLLQPIAVEGVSASPGTWNDARLRVAALWLQRARSKAPSMEIVDHAIKMVAEKRRFHPVRDYLAGLRWDGVPRISRWLVDHCGADDSAYTQGVGRAWLISAVARAMHPGCKVDHVLILQGAQGLGKSTMFKVLAGADWFSDSEIKFGDKDAMQRLRGKWMIELPELGALNRAEVSDVKAFITSTHDDYRASYGRNDERYPRTCVFGGTTNDAKFLKDTTGNRRFWVVQCRKADWCAIESLRDQLWAEAMTAYRNGEQWWLTADLEQAAAEEQSQWEAEDSWEQAIDKWLAGDPPELLERGVPGARRPPSDFTIGDVLTGALGIETGRQTPGDSKRAGALLKRRGYESRQVRRDGKQPRVYTKGQP